VINNVCNVKQKSAVAPQNATWTQPKLVMRRLSKKILAHLSVMPTSAAVLGITLIVVSDALFAVIFNLFNL
jgi:hypothetical protein